MMWHTILVLVALELTQVAVAKDAVENGKSGTALEQEKDDLKTAASNAYPDRYSDWNRGYSSGYGVTGYGSVDDRYGGVGGNRGYDNGYGYDGDYARQGSGGYYDNAGYGGYKGGYEGSYGSSGYGGYGGNAGYGGTAGYGGNAGYGGYGGYSGSGGLNSYYGYNNPNYQGGSNHLGYGYYRRPGYGSIYNSGITPSLVTGYRGYSKK